MASASTQARKCPCGRVYEVLRDNRAQFAHQPWSSLDHDDIDDLSCPACGGLEYVVVPPHDFRTAPTTDSTMFPYFDVGLGCEVRDKAHHTWLMTHLPSGEARFGYHPDGSPKEGRLVRTDGAVDFGDLAAKERYRREERAAEIAAQNAKDAQDPVLMQAKKTLNEIVANGELDLYTRPANPFGSTSF
jgi:hypothetical protein